ncbi:MAG: hypothetical protein M3Z09_04130 [Acidobacteriota bacterium]|nr:hypothetical protein [Acidobacteriota bacterium]
MWRILAALLFFSALLSGANFKLFLADGTYHLVREYKVAGDRVKFYSTERSSWEEMPTALVDLKKTESEKTAHAAAVAEQTKILSEEDKAVRTQQEEVLKIPQDPGVYSLDDGKTLRIFKAAESQYHNNHGRSVLKRLSPVPLVPGKGTVEIPLPRSLSVLPSDRPDIYIQLATEERFGLIKLNPHGQVRIAERVSVLPVTDEAMEEIDQVEIFRKQLTESGLYKIWPKEPLPKGEYAVIEYTPGKLNAQFWDFAIQ